MQFIAVAGSFTSESSPGLCRSSILHWQCGDYTLVNDGTETGFGLDSVLYLACDGE